MTTDVKRKTLVAPSILSADFGRLAEEIRDVEAGGCDWIHVDVMDGHFVPNLTIGPVVVRWIRQVTRLPLDCHLMIENPRKYLADFKRGGADSVTVHYEACPHDLAEALEELGKLGLKRGVSVKPGTPAEVLDPYLDRLDLILVMTVEPGFGGQSFMEETLPKVSYLRRKFRGHISVDGGINAETGRRAAAAGADVLVAGTAIFGEKDRRRAIQALS
ncbi:MAG: ribulose-phosphate 3-epimerase [Candidatus Omnitrophica bacterium]|nr:ribulose-phosphate 3-epimerase [Candidatus Omnitrophota bacterium]